MELEVLVKIILGIIAAVGVTTVVTAIGLWRKARGKEQELQATDWPK